MLELDSQAQVITYEEYHPFGGTAYQAARNGADPPKRYRFTGKERDEQTAWPVTASATTLPGSAAGRQPTRSRLCPDNDMPGLARIIHRAFTPVYGFFWSLNKRLGAILSEVACRRNLVA